MIYRRHPHRSGGGAGRARRAMAVQHPEYHAPEPVRPAGAGAAAPPLVFAEAVINVAQVDCWSISGQILVKYWSNTGQIL